MFRAFHGSPHDFDRFDAAKTYGGEGGQRFGHGLYFAEAEANAKPYRRDIGSGVKRMADTWLKEAAGDRVRALEAFDANARGWADNPASKGIANEQADEMAAIRKAIEGKPPGTMYEVAIKADPSHIADWEKTLAEQTPAVRDALKTLGNFPDSHTVGDIYRQMSREQGAWDKPAFAMRDAGIPGIRHFDAGEAPNYAIFDPAIVEIMRKYGLAGLTAGTGGVAALTGGASEARAAP